jgi:hypothetical protein
MDENWEGLPGSNDHRTVGTRAWCYVDAEWCYPEPSLHCLCCDALLLPDRWRGWHGAAILADAIEGVHQLGHSIGCAAGADMDEGIPGDTRWRETGEPCDCGHDAVIDLLRGGADGRPDPTR